MSGIGPTSQPPEQSAAGATSTTTDAAPETPPPPSSPQARAARLNAANMARSLLPLVAIILAIVGWQYFNTSSPDPVHPVDTSGTVKLAASEAAYPLQVPTGLPKGYQPTSINTDAGNEKPGAPVTLQIGYVTPSGDFAGFVESDDPHATALAAVLAHATRHGTVGIGGQTWTRWSYEHAGTNSTETALTRQVGGVTLLVNGSASERELTTVAGAVRPYSG